MPEDIKIFELLKTDLRGAYVVDGFPSVGLVSTITANYLITALELEQIGILDSIYFPTVSVVRGAEPMNPVRIYAGDLKPEDDKGKHRMVVFISEFQPPANLIKMIASTMLDWMMEQGTGMLISPEGLVIDREEDSEPGEENKAEGEEGGEEKVDGAECKVDKIDGTDKRLTCAYGIASTKKAKQMLEELGIPLFEEGVISGVAGVLLNEGKRRSWDVVSILAEAKPNFPDARASAQVIETLTKIIPALNIDVEPLYSEAELIEEKIKSMHKQAGPTTKKSSVPLPQMYG
jgi:uncharacterized protein